MLKKFIRFLKNDPDYDLDSIAGWIQTNDTDKLMYLLVRKVYDGKLHLHTNPPKGRKKCRTLNTKLNETS
jgi:hypothetical protein